MTQSQGASSGRREYLLAVVAIALGALVSWWALSRPWLTYTEALLGVAPDDDSAFGAATALVTTSGSSLLPLAAAMPVLLLAGIAAVVGSRGVGRRVVGVVVVVAGVVLFASVARAAFITGLASFAPDAARETTTGTAYAFIALGGALLGIAGGILVMARGASWSSLGRGYERATTTPRDDWEALDRGIDPTLDAGPDSGPDHSPEQSNGREQRGDTPGLS